MAYCRNSVRAGSSRVSGESRCSFETAPSSSCSRLHNLLSKPKAWNSVRCCHGRQSRKCWINPAGTPCTAASGLSEAANLMGLNRLLSAMGSEADVFICAMKRRQQFESRRDGKQFVGESSRGSHHPCAAERRKLHGEGAERSIWIPYLNAPFYISGASRIDRERRGWAWFSHPVLGGDADEVAHVDPQLVLRELDLHSVLVALLLLRYNT